MTVFYSPSRVVHGLGSTSTIGQVALDVGIGSGRILLVSDSVLQAAGIVDGPADALRKCGYDVVVHADWVGEPDLGIAAAVVTSAQFPFVAVAGVGGGSVMDMAKFAALATRNDADARELVRTQRTLRSAAPLILVPTTAGTGSEASRVAVLSGDGRKLVVSHPSLVPRVAILDGEMTAGLPRAASASTALDAIAHALESFLSTDSDALTEAHALAAVASLAEVIAEISGDEPALMDRQIALVAAFHAGLSLNAGVVLGHSVAYTIAARSGLPHGVTTAMALPYCLVHAECATAAKQERMFATVAAARRLRATNLVDWVTQVATELGIPGSLAEIGIETPALRGMAEECIAMYPRSNSPRPLNVDDVEILLSYLHGGDLVGYRERELALTMR